MSLVGFCPTCGCDTVTETRKNAVVTAKVTSIIGRDLVFGTNTIVSADEAHMECDQCGLVLQQNEFFDKSIDNEHEEYPREDWQEEASEGSTQLGYWDWVKNQLHAKWCENG